MSRMSGSESMTEEMLRLSRERKMSRGRVRSGTLDPAARAAEVDRLREINERGRNVAAVENRDRNAEVRQNRIGAGAEPAKIDPNYTAGVKQFYDNQPGPAPQQGGRISRRFEQARQQGAKFAADKKAREMGVSGEEYARMESLRGSPGGPAAAGRLAGQQFRDDAIERLRPELDAKYTPEAVEAAARQMQGARYQTGTERTDEMSMLVRGRPSAGTMGAMLSADEMGRPLQIRAATGELTPRGTRTLEMRPGDPSGNAPIPNHVPGTERDVPLSNDRLQNFVRGMPTPPAADRPQYAGAEDVRAGRVAAAQRNIAEEDSRLEALRRADAEFFGSTVPRRTAEAQIGAIEAESAANRAQATALERTGQPGPEQAPVEQASQAYDLELPQQLARFFDVQDNIAGFTNPTLAQTRVRYIESLPEPLRSQTARLAVQAILEAGYSPGKTARFIGPGTENGIVTKQAAEWFARLNALANPQAAAPVEPEPGTDIDRLRR